MPSTDVEIRSRPYKARRLWGRITDWFKRYESEAPSDPDDLEMLKLNLYFVHVGLRPACIPPGNPPNDSMQRFATDFGLGFEEGDYFDTIRETKTCYVLHPNSVIKNKPKFARLTEIYDTNPRTFSQRESERIRIIGEILGFPCLYDNGDNCNSVVVACRSWDSQKTQEVYATTCSTGTLNRKFLKLLEDSITWLAPLKRTCEIQLSPRKRGGKFV